MFKKYKITIYFFGIFIILAIISFFQPIESENSSSNQIKGQDRNGKNNTSKNDFKENNDISYDDIYRNVQEKKRNIIESILKIDLLEVTNEYLKVKIKNTSKIDVRHFNFSISLLNSFNESIGFNNSGKGHFKYESITSEDIIKSNSEKIAYFKTNNIQEFNNYFSRHGNNLGAKFLVNNIKFNNNKEYNSLASSFGYNLSKNSKESIIKGVERELRELQKVR